MACQSDPKMYAVVFRCPLEHGALLKSKADAAGLTISKYVAKMVDEHLEKRELSEEEKVWVGEHFEMNKARRARADKMTAAGYYKHKRRGRPRKPGPRKGTKRNGKILNITIAPSETSISASRIAKGETSC